MKSKERLIQEVEGEALAKRLVIEANSALIDECNALEARLAQVGLQAIASFTVHDKHVTARLLNFNDKESAIRSLLTKAGIEIIAIEYPESGNWKNEVIFTLSGTDILLDAAYARESALQEAA